MILFAIATNLPEIEITACATLTIARELCEWRAIAWRSPAFAEFPASSAAKRRRGAAPRRATT